MTVEKSVKKIWVEGWGVSFGDSDQQERWCINALLNEPDRDPFYAADEHGYIDYPFLSGQQI